MAAAEEDLQETILDVSHFSSISDLFEGLGVWSPPLMLTHPLANSHYGVLA